jgi:dihydroorotase
MNTVCGVCNLVGGFPTFVEPIVRGEEASEYFTQIIDDFDKVSGFEPLNVIYKDAVIHVDETSRLPIATGMPGIMDFKAAGARY